jgi:hypothetical protein
MMAEINWALVNKAKNAAKERANNPQPEPPEIDGFEHDRTKAMKLLRDDMGDLLDQFGVTMDHRLDVGEATSDIDMSLVLPGHEDVVARMQFGLMGDRDFLRSPTKYYVSPRTRKLLGCLHDETLLNLVMNLSIRWFHDIGDALLYAEEAHKTIETATNYANEKGLWLETDASTNTFKPGDSPTANA